MIKKIDHILTRKLSGALKKMKSSGSPKVWSYVYLKTDKDGNDCVDDRRLVMSLDYGAMTPSVLLEQGFGGAKLWSDVDVRKWASVYLRQRKLMFENFAKIDKIGLLNRAADEKRSQKSQDMVEYACREMQSMVGRISVS